MRTLKPWQAFALIAAAAVLIWAPTLVAAQAGDSASYDLNWSRQFTAALAAGHPYPRWTATSFGGLGAPVFYFYPPLPFWVTAGLSIASGGLLGAAAALKAGELAFLLVSGWGLFAWQRGRAGDAGALAGALVFMLAPYHLDDHYLRGAFAEFAAIALLPLLAIGLERAASGARLGPLWLAGAWAAVILCHLPIALLAGVLVIAPHGVWMIWREPGRRAAAAARIAFALATGAGLAAIYVVPALTLQGAISAEYWWGGRFQVGDRLLVNLGGWPSAFEPFFGFLSAGEAAVALVLVWRGWGRRDAEARLWGGIVVTTFLVIAGLVPGFWSLPMMAKVQFPWRAMGVQELAFAALIARSRRADWLPVAGAALAALLGVNALSVGRFMTQPAAVSRPGYGVTSFPTDADAPEYLPEGLLRMTADGPALATPYAALTGRPLATGPVAAAHDDPVSGEVWIQLSPGQGGRVTLRRFAFPAWRVTCDGKPVQTSADGPGRLLTFTPPAGAQSCEATIAPTPQEQTGAALALAAALLLGGYGAWSMAGSLRPARRTLAAAAAA